MAAGIVSPDMIVSTMISQYFRNSMIAFFLQCKLLTEWACEEHAGVDTQWIQCGLCELESQRAAAREALSQYIARPPVSLKKLLA